tara:strand:+ start:113 stop:367 length:255 start_codon:yes stop_codon:yes gene_type:complete
MANDLELNEGSGGQTLSTDQLAGGEHVQHVKLLDGTENGDTAIASGNGTETAAQIDQLNFDELDARQAQQIRNARAVLVMLALH